MIMIKYMAGNVAHCCDEKHFSHAPLRPLYLDTLQ